MTRKPSNVPEITTPNDVVNKILPTRVRLKCKNKTQKDFANLITDYEIVIASGPAGVGKSYVAIARAIELLQNKTNTYEKIIIAKPAVEADEKHGFMPGDMREKMEPHISSSLDIIDKIIGKKARLQLEEAEIILIQPLAFLRGKSIDNSIVIVEEAQNMSPRQMKTLLTRIGNNSKFVISGDLDQSDRFRNVEDSGLYDAIHRHKNVKEIGFHVFSVNDIVRNPIITKILHNYTIDVERPVTKEIKTEEPAKVEVENKVVKKGFCNWFKKNFKF